MAADLQEPPALIEQFFRAVRAARALEAVGLSDVGDKKIAGDDAACFFVRPRPGSDVASVGVVAGSGLVGMRLTDRVAYFVSGVGMPDCLVLGPEMLETGTAGVRAAGYFGTDWSVEGGEFVWQK